MAGEATLQKVGSGLPEPIAKRGINEAQWRTLCNSLFPGANPQSVLLVVDYCAARKLDPLKKPCHIVPMKVKDAKTGEYSWRDVVMPGIYEYRTTAQRTGEYLGHSRPVYGPPVEQFGVTAPEWCELTVYRWNGASAQRVEFPVCVFFREACAVTKDKQTGKLVANDRWSKAPIQMLTKCTEAAGLREAFPDELGGEPTAEEMDGQRAADIAVTVTDKLPPQKPDGYDPWFADLAGAANEGSVTLGEAFRKGAPAQREYLTAVDVDAWEQLKVCAAGTDSEHGGEA